MAEIKMLDSKEQISMFCSKCDPAELLAQHIFQTGSLHAMKFFSQNPTPEQLERMIDQIEQSIGVIEQSAVERGITLPEIKP